MSTLKGKESRYCTHGSTTVSSTEKSLHFWTSLSPKAISLRARWRRLGTDGAPLGDVTFQPFVPIKVKDAVAIPMVTTPDTNGRASQGEELVNQQLNWTTLTQRLDQVKFPLPKGAHLDRMKAHLMDAQNSRSRIFISRHLGLGKLKEMAALTLSSLANEAFKPSTEEFCPQSIAGLGQQSAGKANLATLRQASSSTCPEMLWFVD